MSQVGDPESSATGRRQDRFGSPPENGSKDAALRVKAEGDSLAGRFPLHLQAPKGVCRLARLLGLCYKGHPGSARRTVPFINFPAREINCKLVYYGPGLGGKTDRKSTRLNSSHVAISYAVFCLKKKKTKHTPAVARDLSCGRDHLRTLDRARSKAVSCWASGRALLRDSGCAGNHTRDSGRASRY